MGRARNVRGYGMRSLALSILGRNAEKQIQAALNCSEAQAHRIIQHDRCPGPLRAALMAFLEAALAGAQRRLEAAEDELRQIRYLEMVGRAEARRLETGGGSAVAMARQSEPEQPALNLDGGER